MFCNDVVNDPTVLTDFLSDPETFSCSTCDKIIPLAQEYGLEYLTTSSIGFNNYPNCNLEWNIELNNPEKLLTYIYFGGASSYCSKNLSRTFSYISSIQKPKMESKHRFGAP